MIHFNLIKSLKKLRNSAALVYDSSVAQGNSPEATTAAVKPIQEMMEKLLWKHSKTDAAGCIVAITEFENDAASHARAAKYYIEKQLNAQEHADKIKKLLILRMKSECVAQIIDGDFSVSLSEHDGKTSLVLR